MTHWDEDKRARPLVGQYIETLKPYVPGKPIEELRRERGIQGEILKLASNENPLGPSPLALEAARAALLEGHLYPDGAAFVLRNRLSEYLGVDMARIVSGNGSNELLELIVRTFATSADHAIVSEHSFIVYRIILKSMNVPFTVVPAAADMGHDLVAMARAARSNTRLVFVANPNNQTGTYNGRAELEAMLSILAERPDPPLVVMDEAYFEFADAEDYPDSSRYQGLYPRIVALRTFSKCYGMASFRVGYAVATEEVAGYLHRVRAPFNTNRIGQLAAAAALDDEDFLRRTLELNRVERARVSAALSDMGLEVVPTQANFVLCRTPLLASDLYDKLLDRGIIVRPLDGYALDHHVRISFGTPPQNNRLIEALREVLSP